MNVKTSPLIAGPSSPLDDPSNISWVRIPMPPRIPIPHFKILPCCAHTEVFQRNSNRNIWNETQKVFFMFKGYPSNNMLGFRNGWWLLKRGWNGNGIFLILHKFTEMAKQKSTIVFSELVLKRWFSLNTIVGSVKFYVWNRGWKKWRFPTKIKCSTPIKEEKTMMELKVNVPQIREFLNQIIQAPWKDFWSFTGGCKRNDEPIFKWVNGVCDLFFWYWDKKGQKEM